MKKFIIRFGFGFLILCLTVVIVIVVPVEIFGPDGLPRLRTLKNELDALDQEADRVDEQVSRLNEEIQNLRDDPRAMERIARDELGMAKPDEIIFQFEPETTSRKK